MKQDQKHCRLYDIGVLHCTFWYIGSTRGKRRLQTGETQNSRRAAFKIPQNNKSVEHQRRLSPGTGIVSLFPFDSNNNYNCNRMVRAQQCMTLLPCLPSTLLYNFHGISFCLPSLISMFTTAPCYAYIILSSNPLTGDFILSTKSQDVPEFRVILAGKGGVGKTNFVKRHSTGEHTTNAACPGRGS